MKKRTMIEAETERMRDELASRSVRVDHIGPGGELLRGALVKSGVWRDEDGVKVAGFRRVDHFKVLFNRSKVLNDDHWAAGKKYRRDFELGHEGGMIASNYEKEGGKSAGEVGMSERRLFHLGMWQDANRVVGPLGRTCLQSILLANMTLIEYSEYAGWGKTGSQLSMGVLLNALETIMELYKGKNTTS